MRRIRPFSPSIYTVWQTVVVGGSEFSRVDDLLNALPQSGIPFQDHELRIYRGTSALSSSPRTVNFVKVTPRDLGFAFLPSLSGLYALAKHLSLRVCSTEELLFLCKERRHWSLGERLYVSWNDQRFDDKFFWTFARSHLERHDGSYDGSDDDWGESSEAIRFSLDSQWVFVLPS